MVIPTSANASASDFGSFAEVMVMPDPLDELAPLPLVLEPRLHPCTNRQHPSRAMIGAVFIFFAQQYIGSALRGIDFE